MKKNICMNGILHAKCPFCGQIVAPDLYSRRRYPVWKCTWGAMAAGALICDMDEAADQLLNMLGIDLRVGEAPVPTGKSGALRFVRFDEEAVKRRFLEALAERGYEVRNTTVVEIIQVSGGSSGGSEHRDDLGRPSVVSLENGTPVLKRLFC